MKIVDTIFLSVETFKNRKSRTFLTVLGVGVGIGAVLFLVSLGYGLQNILLQSITTAESFLTLDAASPDPSIIKLNDRLIAKVSDYPEVEKVSAAAVFSSQITSDTLSSEATLNVVDVDYFALNGLSPEIGRVFDPADPSQIVVNTRIAELFNKQPNDILGSQIELVIFYTSDDSETEVAGESSEAVEVYQVEKKFVVVGLFDQVDIPQVYVQKSGLPGLTIDEYQFFKIKVDTSDSLDLVRERLLGEGLIVSAISDVIDQANKIFRIVQIILGIFGIVAVIVAAISLANTMTISLLERTQDIGVMRSIGASRNDIRNLFLIESTMIGFSGGVLGLTIGFIASNFFNFAMSILAHTLGGTPVDLFYTPYWFLLFIMVFSTFVGFITGILPSRRAASLNPLKALRYK